MRFMYTILIGMVVFQGMMILVGPIFPSGVADTYNPVDPGSLETDPDMGNYSQRENTSFSNVGSLGEIVLGMMVTPAAVAIVGVFAVVGSGLGVVFGGVKNFPLALGVGIIIGLMVNLWNSTYSLIGGIAASNEYILGIYSIITVCIGIIMCIMVAEFFLGQNQGVY